MKNTLKICTLAWIVSAPFATSCQASGGAAGDGGDGDSSEQPGPEGPSGGASSDIAFEPSGMGGETTTFEIPRDGGVLELTPEEVTRIGEAACTGWAAEGENLPAVLQFVVDVSYSMGRTEASTGSRTKWEVTKAALESALDELPDSVAVGMLLYPHMSNIGADATVRPVEECTRVDKMVPMAPLGEPGTMQRVSLQDALDGAHIGGRTPTHDAYMHALDYGLKPYPTIARKFMLLITDGAPTISQGCVKGATGTENTSSTDVIINDIEAARADGIRTFLIGSPGSEGASGEDRRPWLSEAAVKGDTAAEPCEIEGPNFCHMDMTEVSDFGAALREGLANVAGEIINACTFSVPDAPDGEAIDPMKTNVLFTRGDGSVALVLPDEQGDCTEGWQFDSDGNIALCAQTCEAIKADVLSNITLNFGCEPTDLLVR